jgi:hypothetical protein
MLAQGQFPRDAGSPPDPATMAQHRVARLTTLLGLSTTQAGQAATIFTNAATATTPLQTDLSGFRTSIQTAVKSNATATIDQLAASIGTTIGQITAIQEKAQAAFYAILDSTQQAKLDAIGGPDGGFGGPGPGGPGFGRGPGRH